MITLDIQVDDRNVTDVLAELQRRLTNMTPAMKQIGDVLVASTKHRFATSTGPDGLPWAPNSMVTYLRMIDRRAGTTLKRGANTGRLNAKGVGVAAGKKPLIGETRRLSTEIYPQVDANSVEIGSSLVYAATQQFGAKMGAFGRYSQVARWRKYEKGDFRKHAGTVKGFPIPWGDIPARPFIGLSTSDEESVLAIVTRYLQAGFDV
jgi:phage gpG-like protein